MQQAEAIRLSGAIEDSFKSWHSDISNRLEARLDG
jgi:hypothetical protein